MYVYRISATIRRKRTCMFHIYVPLWHATAPEAAAIGIMDAQLRAHLNPSYITTYIEEAPNSHPHCSDWNRFLCLIKCDIYSNIKKNYNKIKNKYC